MVFAIRVGFSASAPVLCCLFSAQRKLVHQWVTMRESTRHSGAPPQIRGHWLECSWTLEIVSSVEDISESNKTMIVESKREKTCASQSTKRKMCDILPILSGGWHMNMAILLQEIRTYFADFP